VITTPLTFCATVNAILHAGATPVLADVDPVTMNLDPARVAERITPRTKAILPVHFAGRPCDMDRLMALAAQHSLVVIEDCAHAIETEYRGQAAGTFGAFGCFSFYATKNLTTGEGGMVLTRRREDHERIKTLSLHGLSLDASKRFGKDGYKHYQVTEAGFKYNLTDLQASLGIHQLHKIEAGWLRRKAIWERYLHEFAALPLALPAPFEPGTRHALHLFTVGLDERRAPVTRDQFLTALGKRGIGVGVHYVSVPEHAFYQATLGWKPEEWPQAHALGRHTASLPLSPKLTDAEVDRVVAAVKAVVS
jgi:dTDP-4-amino-4,6-dideoxygalactose transaminase